MNRICDEVKPTKLMKKKILELLNEESYLLEGLMLCSDNSKESFKRQCEIVCIVEYLNILKKEKTTKKS